MMWIYGKKNWLLTANWWFRNVSQWLLHCKKKVGLLITFLTGVLMHSDF